MNGKTKNYYTKKLQQAMTVIEIILMRDEVRY